MDVRVHVADVVLDVQKVVADATLHVEAHVKAVVDAQVRVMAGAAKLVVADVPKVAPVVIPHAPAALDAEDAPAALDAEERVVLGNVLAAVEASVLDVAAIAKGSVYLRVIVHVQVIAMVIVLIRQML